MVYVVVAFGFAVTFAPIVELKPVAGVQLYVVAPFAVSVAVCCPAQMLALLTEIVGVETTVTVDVAVFLQLFVFVPVTVYTVVVFGFAVTMLPFAELKLPEGLHV